MSNYPPGVTGNEFQIAGPDYEQTEHRTCTAQDIRIRTISRWGDELLAALISDSRAISSGSGNGLLNGPGTINRLNQIMAEIECVDVVADCPFEGEVDVTGYQGERWWTCPICRTEHTEDADDGD